MKKRGKVLRDTNPGPGLLMAEGQQYAFSLEGVWKSETPPRIGMVVEGQFDEAGKLFAVSAVPDSQLAREQAEAAMAGAREKGAALASSMVAKFGMPTLVATGVLIVGWFFLSAVSIQTPLGSLDFTFWQVLGFLNSRNLFEALMQGGRGVSSPGFYGLLAIVAMAGPFIHHFWKDKRAILGRLLPLVFMAIVGIAVRSSIQSSLAGGEASGDFGAAMKQMQEEAMKAISLGLGAYVSGLVSLYFAAVATKQFMASQGTEQQEQPRSHKAAA